MIDINMIYTNLKESPNYKPGLIYVIRTDWRESECLSRSSVDMEWALY